MGDAVCLPGDISVHHGRSGPVRQGIVELITYLNEDGGSQANKLGVAWATLNSFKFKLAVRAY